MFSRVSQFLTPPVFENREKTRRTRVLYQAVLVMLLFGVLLTIGSASGLAPNPLRASLITSQLIVLTLVCLWLIRRGHPRFAAILLSTAIWCLLSTMVVLFGGLRSPGYSMYIVLGVIVGFTLGARAVGYYAALTSLSILLLIFADTKGWVPKPISLPVPADIWLVDTLALGVVALLIRYALRSTESAMHEAQANEAKALQAISEVEEGRQLLETRAQQWAEVAELGQAALMEASTVKFADHAVRSVAKTLNVDCVNLLQWLPHQNTFRLYASTGLGDGCAGLPNDSIPHEQAQYALHIKHAIISEDLTREERFFVSPFLLEQNIVSAASIMIPGAADPFGVLNVYARKRRSFSNDDVNFLRAVANLIAFVMRRAASETALRESEQQLRQSQKMEAIGQLAGGVAHDFNNLLTIIASYAEILLDGVPEESELHSAPSEILRTVDQAAALTRQLLAFSRNDTPHLEIVNLNESIRELEKMLGRLIGEHIELRLELDAAPATVEIDPGQIEQIVLNLAVNARDAMPMGGIFTIQTRHIDRLVQGDLVDMTVEPEHFVALRISDTGVGIDPETQARIFEPFFTTKAPGRGTGLGLSTVYGIVHQSKGKISVGSELGSGTTFEILLPVAELPVEETQYAAISRDHLPQGSETILLVEDEPKIRNLIRTMLTTCGYQVISAANGREGLDLALQHEGPIDMLLSDIVMPKMSGSRLATELRRFKPDLKVVFISGYAETPDRGTDPLPIHDGYIQKPFTFAQIMNCVRQALDA